MKTDNRAELLKYAKKLDISGVELLFLPYTQVHSFKLSKEDISYLKGLDYVSLHPMKPKVLPEKEYNSWLKRVFEIYQKVDAKGLVIHPDELQNTDIKDYGFNLMTENVGPKFNISRNDLGKIMKKFDAGLCLDVVHAYKHSKFETTNLIKDFKNKIKQVHFSGRFRNNSHISLRHVSRDFLWSIKKVKDLNVPIVIEEDILNKNINEVKKEIKLIKSLFE